MTDTKPTMIPEQVEDLERSVSQGKVVNEKAAEGNKVETHMTFRQAVRLYRKAVAWSVIVSMATVMESFGLQIVTSFYAFPQFNERFGVKLPSGKYTTPAKWQLALSLSMCIGLICGVFANGYLADRFGLRKTMAAAMAFLTGAIFIEFYASTIEMLFAGLLICSLPFGIFAAAAPAYAAEICPMALRGYLTTYVNLCWVMGHFVATGVITSLVDNETQWSYRLPFALQWMWPAPLMIAFWFCPDSPWWLVRNNRKEEAEDVVRNLLIDPEGVVNVSDVVAMMEHTIRTERELHIGSSYVECFKGTNRRRTEIAMLSWGCQILPGFAIQNYTTYFFLLAGLSSTNSFKLSLGMFSIAFVGTTLSWFLQHSFGRRTIYMTGLVAMLPIMWIIGFLDLAPSSGSSSVKWAQSSLLTIWFFAYGASIGPIPYAIAAEVGASNLRIKTIALGRNMYYFLSLVNSVVAPYMLNAAEGNLKGKAAFPAAVFTACLLVWAYFRLPETKGVLPETMDILFDRRVPARQFKREADAMQP